MHQLFSLSKFKNSQVKKLKFVTPVFIILTAKIDIEIL